MVTRRACVVAALLLAGVPALAQPAGEAPAEQKPSAVEARVQALKDRGQTFLDTMAGKNQPVASHPWDLTGSIAHFMPAPARAWTLVGLDLLLPVLVATPMAIAGAVAGGWGLWQVVMITSKNTNIPPFSPEVMAGAALGSVAAGMLTLFLADLAFNTFHLKWLIPARLTFLITLGLGAAALAAGLLLGAPMVAPWHALAGPAFNVAGAVALGAFFIVLAPVALAASGIMRLRSDEQEGSAMWQASGRTGLE